MTKFVFERPLTARYLRIVKEEPDRIYVLAWTESDQSDAIEIIGIRESRIRALRDALSALLRGLRR